MNQYDNNTPVQNGAWKTLFQMIYQPEKRLFHRLIVVALFTAIVDASFTLVTKAIVDDIVALGPDIELLSYGLIFAGLTVSIAASIWCFIRLAGQLSTRLMYRLRKESFEHLQTLSFRFFDQNAVGWLLARITSDTNRIANVIAWGTLDLCWGVPFLIGIFVVLLVLNWQLGLIVLALVPVLLAVAVWFNLKILDSSRKLRQTNSRITAIYNESLSGVQTSKVLGREDENLHEFQSDTRKIYFQSMQNLLLTSAFYPFVNVFVSVSTGIALWLGGADVLAGTLTLGTLVAFMSYTRSLMDPMLEVSGKLAELQRATASVERVIGLLQVTPEIQDSDTVLASIQQATDAGHAVIDGGDDLIETIEFRDVSFGYKPEETVLKRFNLRVNKGETIALVGATGSGKSTIISLLCRFYEPSAGEILLNGTDYRQRSLAWLQSNLGIVQQTPFLFTGTIRSNIRYGNLDATDAEIEAAAKAVNLHDFILQMENGYETAVQEGGNNLSTGQKQLISFARAVVADPQILVMDEATSSVDTQTEHVLQHSLQQVLHGRTSFVVAHRLSTIRAADRILVIDQGELKEQGSHEMLIAQQGRYYELYRKQFQSEAESAVTGT
ncbi:putative multidrug resistance ABC transporter ATP-binding/permease protein YheH [Vibrio aerogenes CECT 7868]|uniref:Putative multidrug resistance ABC transporter ATP-binding/permease protein YheH n=1 Tax=Vibrio aerogenes CECT 7868 TaxID=1216006 RepID=A0A1M6AG19_9VIBR|nr:ABC transporter ATP-binding protein [Vibrio aerogenes]SHI35409.1 putative multidrug resistance ABC transporter ATP-binding/permease protein YheH [Vibrio aerogenes CECT 7868]